MTDNRHDATVMRMMNALYAEDSATAPHDSSKFAQTLLILRSEPARGRVILFLDERDSSHGYAILIPFWSNELGGAVAFVDELYVIPDSRRLGIARGLFEFVNRERPFEAVAMSLEVSPKNQKAWNLYTSVGFEPRPFTTMLWRMPAR